MIQIAICDDEEIFVKQIHSEVEKILSEKNVEFNISDYTDGRKLLEEYEFKKFDLVLLDIDMPELKGNEIAHIFRNDKSDTVIIFVSNFDSYVFESFKYNVFRFIRKKFFENEIKEAIDSFFKSYILENIEIEVITNSKEKTHIKCSDIIYIYSLRHDIFINTAHSHKNSIRLKPRQYSIEKLDDMLKDAGFLRVHKSYLMNYKYINEINSKEIITISNEIIPISRNRYEDIVCKYKLLLRRNDKL